MLREHDVEGICADNHSQFYNALYKEEQLLIALKQDHYKNSWCLLREAFEIRRREVPICSNLYKRTLIDLKRINSLWSYEIAHDVDLSEYRKPQRAQKRVVQSNPVQVYAQRNQKQVG